MASSTSGKLAQTQVLNPPTPRTPSIPREHLARARSVPGPDDRKAGVRRLPRAACRGERAQSLSSQDVFNEVVFGGNPSERPLRIEQLDEKTKTLWNQKPDDWGNPLRPAN